MTAEQKAAARRAAEEMPDTVLYGGERGRQRLLCMIDDMPETTSFEERVQAELAAIGAMLVEKNRAYGNSALDPIRVFSKADPVEQLKVRLDDKLSRLKRGLGAETSAADAEDVILDLIGYLVLLRIAVSTRRMRDQSAGHPKAQREEVSR